MAEVVEAVPLRRRLRVHLVQLVEHRVIAVAELHDRVVERQTAEQRRVDELDWQAIFVLFFLFSVVVLCAV